MEDQKVFEDVEKAGIQTLDINAARQEGLEFAKDAGDVAFFDEF